MFSCMCHQANNSILSAHEKSQAHFKKKSLISTDNKKELFFFLFSRKTRYLETVRRDKWATLSMKYYAYWDI